MTPRLKPACGRASAPLDTRKLGPLLMDSHRSSPRRSIVGVAFANRGMPAGQHHLGGAGKPLTRESLNAGRGSDTSAGSEHGMESAEVCDPQSHLAQESG